MFEYQSPLHQELRDLGYAVEYEPTEEDLMLMRLIVNDPYSDLRPFTDIFYPHWYRFMCKSALRVYAYYINNPQQFAGEPSNIMPSAIKHSFNTAKSLLSKFAKVSTKGIKIKSKLCKRFNSPCAVTWYKSAKKIADKVKWNDEVGKYIKDYNTGNKIHISLFR